MIRQKMQIKWNRELKERWYQVIGGRVSAVPLPALVSLPVPVNPYAKPAICN